MAYAALVSLAEFLKQLLHSDHYAVQYPKPQIESLYGKVCSLQSSFGEIFPLSKSRRSEVNDLEVQIREAVYKAQDTIESLIVRQIRASESEEIPEDQNSTSVLLQELEEIPAKLDLITETAETIRRSITQSKNDRRRRDLMSEEAWASKFSFSSKSNMFVGRDDVRYLLDVLTSGSLQHQVVAITGLPGVGKTALVKNIFGHVVTLRHFDVRCRRTVSEEYRVREILSTLVDSMATDRESWRRSEGELGEILYKQLSGRRYLIVMDDIWDEQFWHKVEIFFPDNNNGSRIFLTTRNAAVADSANVHHVIRPLDQENSWMLLRRVVFGKEDCPPALEDIGRNIAEKCGGISLSIVVVGGRLSQGIRTEEYWKSIEDDVRGAAAKGQKSYLEILSLSYNNLPSGLKACFLYIGAFPKDGEILVSKLIKLWVAEGFLPPPSSPSESLEQVAKQHLRVLIS